MEESRGGSLYFRSFPFLSLHSTTTRVGEYHRSFKTAPLKPPNFCLGLFKSNHQKNASKQLQIGFKVFLLPNALPQGQLTEVPLYFEIFNIKVDGQTI